MCGTCIISFNHHTNPLREILFPIFNEKIEAQGLCVELAQDCTASKWSRPSAVLNQCCWNHGFYQLELSRAVYPMFRSTIPNTQPTDCTRKPTAGGIFRGCCTFSLWLAEVKKEFVVGLNQVGYCAQCQKYLVKIIWRVVIAEKCLEAKYVPAPKCTLKKSALYTDKWKPHGLNRARTPHVGYWAAQRTGCIAAVATALCFNSLWA